MSVAADGGGGGGGEWCTGESSECTMRVPTSACQTPILFSKKFHSGMICNHARPLLG